MRPVAVLVEQLPVDARLVVVALEVAEARELDQVRVALVRLGEERQVRVALLLRLAVVGDVDLAAEKRLDALLLRLLDEVDRAGERAVVGERRPPASRAPPPAWREPGSGTPRRGSSTRSGRGGGRKGRSRARESHRTRGSRRGPCRPLRPCAQDWALGRHHRLEVFLGVESDGRLAAAAPALDAQDVQLRHGAADECLSNLMKLLHSAYGEIVTNVFSVESIGRCPPATCAFRASR